MARLFARLPVSSIAAILLMLAPRSAAAARPSSERAPTASEALDADATLHDVCFVDRRHGWAVGDRGVVLRTVDGGQNWRQLTTPLATPLYAVSFVDHQHGWAVGGEVRPYTHDMLAVVLKTSDGGDTWRRQPAPLLPLLRDVQFFDRRRGVAVGACTAFAPAGVFLTDDGGRGWRPMSIADRQSRPSPGEHWLTARWRSSESGVVLNGAGNLLRARKASLHATEQPRGRSRVCSVAFASPSELWAAGDGVMHSKDGGRRWVSLDAPLPPPFDELPWRAVAARGQWVWLAGSPGNAILASPDGGQSWQVQPTGVSSALNDIEFIDERNGWAVGDLGAIVSTTDGGKNWRTQRGGDRRAAVLVVAETPAAVPLELIANLGAAEGYRMAVHTLRPPVGESPASATARLREAATCAGASVVEPIAAGDAGAELLARNLALAVLRLRPELVFVAPESRDGSPSSAATIRTLVEEALAAAGHSPSVKLDELVFPPPHQPKRVAFATREGEPATGRMATGNYHPTLGATLSGWVGYRNGLLHASPEPSPVAVSWRLGAVRSGPPPSGRDPLAGIALPPGGPYRRPPAKEATNGLVEVRELAVRRRAVQHLLAAAPSATSDSGAWQRRVIDLTSGLSADAGAQLLHRLANSYRRLGQPQRAADAFYLLLVRYTDHPLADSALEWVVRYYASAEVGHAATRTAAHSREQTRPPEQTEHGVAVAGFDAGDPSSAQLDSETRLKRALQLADYLEQSRPTLFARPGLRRTIAAAAARAGEVGRVEKTHAVLGGASMPEPWRRAAEAELWLAGRKATPPPAAMVEATRAEEPPLLDGKLNDACWQSEGIGPDGARSYLASDSDYFYLAGRVTKRAGVLYPKPAGGRTRDSDLTPYDRVVFAIDTDRDFATEYELAIDSRGWTADRCWGEQPWDPRWYVAVRETAEAWTFEAAIAKAELAGETGSEAWAVAVTRRTPGVPPVHWPARHRPGDPENWRVVWLTP
ncbi:MAG: YCF48-related protein [Planctomycetota bacterium]